jgi:two-component system cell cycle response regulator DivK
MLSFEVRTMGTAPGIQIYCDEDGLKTLQRMLDDVRRIGHAHLFAPLELNEKTPFGADAVLEVSIKTGAHSPVSKRVLIVEDNDLNMKLVRDLLEAQGYATLQTKDGMEALKLARQHHPDLILMDIQLPEVSGIEVTKWLKADDDLMTIPIIAVTAFAMKGDEEKIREGGCEAYIAKPISVISFLKTVERFLSRELVPAKLPT